MLLAVTGWRNVRETGFFIACIQVMRRRYLRLVIGVTFAMTILHGVVVYHVYLVYQLWFASFTAWFLQIVRHELLSAYAYQLLEKEYRGCHALLRDDKVLAVALFNIFLFVTSNFCEGGCFITDSNVLGGGFRKRWGCFLK